MKQRGPYDTKSKHISPKKVIALIEAGVSQKSIAALFAISITTLKRRFNDCLANAKDVGVSKRSQNLNLAISKVKSHELLV